MITYRFYSPIIRLATGLIVLVLIGAILKAIPMIRRLVIPGVPISAIAIISAIIGVVMISLLLTFRREFIPQLRTALPNSPESERIALSAINVGIITVAFVSFDGIVLPLMKGMSWIYPLIFLLAAVPSLWSLVTELHGSSGRISDLLTRKIAEATGELIECPKCKETINKDDKFCSNCGAALTTQTPATVVICGRCRSLNKSSSKFCSSCGDPL